MAMAGRVQAVYEGEEYTGENCLHIAIVNQDHVMAITLAKKFPRSLRQVAPPTQRCWSGCPDTLFSGRHGSG